MTILSILLGLVVIVAVCYAAFWLIGQGVPEPIALLLRIIVVVLGLFALYHLAISGGLHLT